MGELILMMVGGIYGIGICMNMTILVSKAMISGHNLFSKTPTIIFFSILWPVLLLIPLFMPRTNLMMKARAQQLREERLSKDDEEDENYH